MPPLRLCIDIDGVLCELRGDQGSYAEVTPTPGARDAIAQLKRAGHIIILCTSRNMRTRSGSVGLVTPRHERDTIQWLERHGFEYDELHFDQPDADVFLDNKALMFRSWSTQDLAALSRRLGSAPTNAPLDRTVETSGRLSVVVPVAGRGSRFANDPRFKVPKPMIDVAGKAMVWWALGSFEGLKIEKLVFVAQGRHERQFNIGAVLRGSAEQLRAEGRLFFDECTVILEEAEPRGQLTSVLIAEEVLPAASAILIGACDTLVHSRLVDDLANVHRRTKGVLSVMKAKGDRWSFARTDSDGRVVEVREKRRISDNACTGLYYFTEANEFLAVAKSVIDRSGSENGEHYVAPIYQEIINSGGRVELSHADSVFEMGTPASLDRFLITLRKSIVP